MRDTVESGSLVLDATVGNGQDTLFLAALVGPSGLVVGFDIQEQALSRASVQLTAAGLLPQVRLVHGGHEHAAEVLRTLPERPFMGAMYNLGYLPGSDRSIITQPATTVASLKDVTALLNPGGTVTIVAYRGHTGGAEESAAVLSWSASLAPGEFQVSEYRSVNAGRNSPHLLIVSRI